MQSIYSNPEIMKVRQKKIADKIWDGFGIMSLKNEFTFTFQNKENQKEFQTVLLKNENILDCHQLDGENFANVEYSLRSILKLDLLHQKFQIPSLIESMAVKPTGQKLQDVMKIDHSTYT
jgi:hypothetical protein